MSLLLLVNAACYGEVVVSFGLLQKTNKKFIHLHLQIQLPITYRYNFQTP